VAEDQTPHSASDSPAGPPDSASACGGNARSLRVIVAEDEPAIRLVLVNKLRQAGFAVRDAANGEDALALAKAERPDLIITDFQMPRLDGLAMAKALFAEIATQDVPVVVLSARGHRLGAADVANTNVQQVLMKPFSMREILAIAQEYSDRCGLASQPTSRRAAA
jgi:two-component system, OmpR family, alkaline phosphatase synthesis response regulator PhoP